MSTSPDIFLSYSREDQTTARRFADSLEAQGFSVWWDAALQTGENFDQAIEKALTQAKAVVVLWSKQSVDSRWVRAEATEAVRNQTFVPVMIEPCKRPIIFELTHTADLSHWSGDPNHPAWQALVAELHRFVARGAVDRVAAPTAAHSIAPAHIHWYQRRPLKFAIIALPVLIAFGVIYLAMRALVPVAQPAASRAPQVPAGASATESIAPQAVASVVSLAVLPFADMSPEHNQDYFSDGLSEELLNQLAQFKDLQVTGRTSSFSFKGKTDDLRVIGQKLGVNHLLDGSVRKDGKQLRINVELINAGTGATIWSHSYDGELDNVFALQEEIAKNVAGALSVTLGVGTMTTVATGTTNFEAYDKYLRARVLWTQQGGVEGLVKAVPLYNAAVALDPGFVRAWYELGTALTFLPNMTGASSAATAKQLKQAYGNVQRLAPNSWQAQNVRGLDLLLQKKFAQAEAAYIVAFSEAPASEDTARGPYMGLLGYVGRIKDLYAINAHERMADPLSLSAAESLARSLEYLGRRPEAQAEYDRGRDLTGDHTTWIPIGMTLQWSRKDADIAAVKADLRTYLKATNALGAIQALPDKLDDNAAARAVIRKAFDDPSNQKPDSMRMIAIYADHFGDKDLALAALQRFAMIGFDDIFWFPWETGLRADRRFKQIMRDTKIADYWRASGKWSDFCHPVGEKDFECQ